MEKSGNNNSTCRNGGEVLCMQNKDGVENEKGPTESKNASENKMSKKKNEQVSEIGDKDVLGSKTELSKLDKNVYPEKEPKISLQNMDNEIEDKDTSKHVAELKSTKISEDSVKDRMRRDNEVNEEKCYKETNEHSRFKEESVNVIKKDFSEVENDCLKTEDTSSEKESLNVSNDIDEQTKKIVSNNGKKMDISEAKASKTGDNKLLADKISKESQFASEKSETSVKISKPANFFALSKEEEKKVDEDEERAEANKVGGDEETKKGKVEKKDKEIKENEEVKGDAKMDDKEMDCEDSGTDDSDKETDDYPLFAKRASNDPNFAVVFSFLTLFGGLLNIPEFSIKDLEESLDNCTDFATDAAHHGLLEKLHLKLLRRLSRSYKTQFSSLAQVSSDRLLKYLIRFSKHCDLDLAWDLEKFGYHVLGSSERLILLKALCEIHFDENPRFKTHFTDEYIKTDNIDGLRLQPFGRDINGKMIRFQQDHLAGFRVYSVEDDDADGNTWKLIASTIEELDTLVAKLKKKVEVNPKDIAVVKRKERKEKALAKIGQEKKKSKSKSKAQQRKKQEMNDSESDDDDDNPCAYCYSNKRPDLVLLCDACDAAYHTLCLRPPLMTIPEGDWNCPYCQQNELIEMLEAKHKELTSKIKAIERASKKAIFDDIKLSNIVNQGHEADDSHSRRSGRQKKSIDYNFSEFDEIIKDATQDGTKKSDTNIKSFYGPTRQQKKRGLNNLEDVGSNSSGNKYESGSDNEKRHTLTKVDDFLERGCRRSRRLKKRFKEDNDEDSSESDDDCFVRRSTRRRTSAQRKYMDYGSDSEMEECNTEKKNQKEDDEEYEVSELDDDYEEEMKIKRRSIVEEEVDEQDDDDEEEEETDEDFENEALHEEFKKDLIDDESEEDAVEETDEDGEPKLDDDSDDSEVYRKKKRKRRLEEDDESDEEAKNRGGKDMRNIIKSLQEEEKIASKTTTKKAKSLDLDNGSDIDEEYTGNDVNELSGGNDVNEHSGGNDVNEHNDGTDVIKTNKRSGMVEDSKESDKESKSEDSIVSKDGKGNNNDKAVKGSDVTEINKGIYVHQANNGSDADQTSNRKRLSETDKARSADEENKKLFNEEPNEFGKESDHDEHEKYGKPGTDCKDFIEEKSELENEDMGVQNSKTERCKKQPATDRVNSEDLLTKNELLLSENKSLQQIKREETVSPLFNEFENVELEKLRRESFLDSLNKPKPISSHFQGEDPSELSKRTKGPFYPNIPTPAANFVPHRPDLHRPEFHRPDFHRPDLLPITPQQGHRPDIYRPKTVAGEFKQPFDYYTSQQQHMSTFSPMHNPYTMHSPQQGFYGGRQDHYPSHMQPMLKAAPPMYQGHQSLPGSSIWRPQETADMEWGHPQHAGGFSPRTTKPTAAQGYPYIGHPGMNFPNSEYIKDYGAPKISSSSSKPAKKAAAPPWQSDDKVTSQTRSTTESYAAFQSMVIGSASDGQRKRSKKGNR